MNAVRVHASGVRGMLARMTPLRLVVLGASGGCGKHLVEQARKRGHDVLAVARPSSKAEGEVRRGDLCSVPFLRECFHGRDAVLSALGLRMPGLSPFARAEVPDFLDRSTPAIVEAMRAEGVRRVMAISAGGVGDSHDDIPKVFKVIIATTSLRTAYAALERMEGLYLASGLDVCLPRPTGLTDEPATGKVVIARGFAGRATISRADVAGWMLSALEAPAFPEKTPMITVTGAA
jgi:nucleoside-diphosphate-sugar epimerase